jgi:hypothetical protein
MNWIKEDLILLVNNRLAELMKGVYTNHTPKASEILPDHTKKYSSPLAYMLQRTLMRPRDILDFLTSVLNMLMGKQNLTGKS